MTRFMKISFLGAALAVSTQIALADPIKANLGENGTATMTTNSSSITSFTLTSGTISTINSAGGSTITPTYAVGDNLTFSNTAFNTGAAFSSNTVNPNGSNSTMGGTLLFSDNKSVSGPPMVPNYLNFFVNSYTVTSNYYCGGSTTSPCDNSALAGTGSVSITGMGYFTETGYTTTLGTFTLNVNSNGTTTFSSNQLSTVPAATPEPSSLMLLGTGLLSAAGMALRKRKLA